MEQELKRAFLIKRGATSRVSLIELSPDGERGAKDPDPIGNRDLVLRSCRFSLDKMFGPNYKRIVLNRTIRIRPFIPIEFFRRVWLEM